MAKWYLKKRCKWCNKPLCVSRHKNPKLAKEVNDKKEFCNPTCKMNYDSTIAFTHFLFQEASK